MVLTGENLQRVGVLENVPHDAAKQHQQEQAQQRHQHPPVHREALRLSCARAVLAARHTCRVHIATVVYHQSNNVEHQRKNSSSVLLVTSIMYIYLSKYMKDQVKA